MKGAKYFCIVGLLLATLVCPLISANRRESRAHHQDSTEPRRQDSTQPRRQDSTEPRAYRPNLSTPHRQPAGEPRGQDPKEPREPRRQDPMEPREPPRQDSREPRRQDSGDPPRQDSAGHSPEASSGHRQINTKTQGNPLQQQKFGIECIDQFFIIAFTVNTPLADTYDSPYFSIVTWYGNYTFQLYDRAGNDFQPSKGDIWYYNTTDYPFYYDCITVCDIVFLELLNGGNDGWLMETIFVVISVDNCGSPEYSVLSADVNINKWLDGDQTYYETYYILDTQNLYCI